MLAIVVSAYDPPQNPELRLGVLFWRSGRWYTYTTANAA